MPKTASAESATTAVTLDQNTIARGYTVELNDDMSLGLPIGTASAPINVTISSIDRPDWVSPANLFRISPVYQYDIVSAAPAEFSSAFALTIGSEEDSLYLKKIMFYDRVKGAWRNLKNASESSAEQATAITKMRFAQIAVFSDHTRLIGGASWYRSTRYPNGVASNDFPFGSLLRVTNIENKKTTIVKIVSTGPFVRGRVVDLSHTAFKQIAKAGEGLITVKVELASVGKGATPAKIRTSSSPKISAVVGFVYSPMENSVLFDQDSGETRPLASLTKLMTALVVLDKNPLLTGEVTIIPEDKPTDQGSVAIRVGPGDRISVRDLFFSTLTGSANNAAYALARSTGLDKKAFVSAMNERAKTMGLDNIIFTDPSGLDTGNLATAQDVARLLNSALDHDVIRSATSRKTYTYKIINTGEKRTIKNPIFMGSSALNDEPLIGGKTGYINESLYNIALGVKKDDKRLIVVVLGSPNRTRRNLDAETLIHFALNSGVNV